MFPSHHTWAARRHPRNRRKASVTSVADDFRWPGRCSSAFFAPDSCRRRMWDGRGISLPGGIVLALPLPQDAGIQLELQYRVVDARRQHWALKSAAQVGSRWTQVRYEASGRHCQPKAGSPVARKTPVSRHYPHSPLPPCHRNTRYNSRCRRRNLETSCSPGFG